MDAQLLAKMISPTRPDGSTKTTSEVMRELNLLIDINNVDSREKVNEADIRFAEFMEQFVVDSRTKDIVYVTTFYNKAYSDLFITVEALREELNAYQRETVAKVFQALTRLGKPELLTTGLSKKTIKKYCTLKENNDD